jgi:hypothetical protein
MAKRQGRLFPCIVPGAAAILQSRDIATSVSRRAKRRGVLLQARETLQHTAGGWSHRGKEAM